MKKGNDHSQRKVRNNKVKKKRKTIKRKSTYKRKKNKNKKRTIKQKGGNLGKILAVGAGVVLTGALAGVFARSSFNSFINYNENLTSPENGNVAESPQNPQGIIDVNNKESMKYSKSVSGAYKMGFIERYSRNDAIEFGGHEKNVDTAFITAWTTLIINLNSHIKFIQENGYENSKKCIENLEILIVSFDKKSMEEGITTLKELAPERGERQIDAFIKSYINFIIMSIFMISLNESGIDGNISYSKVFDIDELNNQIKLINPDSNVTVEKELVEKIFNDSLELLNDMDNIIKETLKEREEITDEILFNKLSNKYFPGLFDLETHKGSDTVFSKDVRPLYFYEEMIERNRREMTQN